MRDTDELNAQLSRAQARFAAACEVVIQTSRALDGAGTIIVTDTRNPAPPTSLPTRITGAGLEAVEAALAPKPLVTLPKV